jgi:dienelactone hydrolase
MSFFDLSTRAAGLAVVDYQHEGVSFKGRLALPVGAGPHPAIMVMHDARGLGDGTARRARALADLGYIALAADMYGDGVFFADPKLAGPSVAPLMQDPSLLRARSVAAFMALRDRDDVDRDRLGAIGFCLGGRCALELARSGVDVKAVVSLHGLLTTHAPATPGSIKGKVLVLTGARDPYAPLADVEALRAEMTAAGADHHVTIYGEGWHGFSEEEAGAMRHVPGVQYDPLLDRLSWAQSLAFLEALLRD